MEGEGFKCMIVCKQGLGVVIVGDIQIVGDVEVFNLDFVFCIFDEGFEMCMEFMVNMGKGYYFLDCNCLEDVLIGLILVDSLYFLVKKVFYKVENICEG